MIYDRKVRYLDLYEKGSCVGGGGFVKIERYEDKIRMEINIKNRRMGESVLARIFLIVQHSTQSEEAQKFFMGKINIVSGEGHCCTQVILKNEEILNDEHRGAGIYADEICGICIEAEQDRRLVSEWKAVGTEMIGRKSIPLKLPDVDPPNPNVNEQAEQEAAAFLEGQGRDEQVAQEAAAFLEGQGRDEQAAQEDAAFLEGQGRDEQAAQEDAAFQEGQGKDEQVAQEDAAFLEGQGKDEQVEQENDGFQDKQDISEVVAPSKTDPTRKETEFAENKWKQLNVIYPHISPFKDKREYLSLGPSDFVVLSEDSYKAAYNSFLLHGYHSYHHLILTKMVKEGKNCYLLGVPGTYFDQEKQVAIMFGFESFECKEEPAQIGDFGYYMMRVKL